jgi:hypothetical protein
VRQTDVIMYAYIAWDLLTNLETFFTLIDVQKKCYGKYTPKAVFCCWFIYTKYLNEIMILEMIYRNRTKRHVWAKSTKTI